jgi:2-keto-4-pentenoate hydratase/2-oxohepta-3-ene-1,7-dioic acid hydratase in catechol pathway
LLDSPSRSSPIRATLLQVTVTLSASTFVLMAWSRLIRFVDDDNKITYGEPCFDSVSELEEKLESKDLFASELVGSDVFALSATGRQLHVQQILGPLTADDVPIIRCIGLNYMKHSEALKRNLFIFTNEMLAVAEGGRKPPPYPSLFIKPSTCIADSDEDIPIPKIAQNSQLDYEGELVSTTRHLPKLSTDFMARQLLSAKRGRISLPKTL